MKIINIYDKAFNQLTSFTEVDFINLSFQRTQGEIGDCTFTVPTNISKINTTNTNHYNRIKVFEEGKLVFTGIITRKTINLNTINIRCREISYILKKRVLSANYVANGSVTDTLTAILAYINGIEDTGISVGILAGIGNVNLTLNRTDIWSAIKQICQSTGNQFEISPTGKLNVRNFLGLDLSETVSFRYDATLIANANILDFEIDDDGDSIQTLAHGESQGLVSDYPNTALVAKYGVLEGYKDFRVVNSQPVLDQFTQLEIEDLTYSPKITLKSTVVDNFNIFDAVKIKIKNSTVNINNTFQIVQKRVKYIGVEKVIEVRINNVPNYLVRELADRENRLTLLEKQL